jgi:chromosome segregation ATPase
MGTAGAAPTTTREARSALQEAEDALEAIEQTRAMLRAQEKNALDELRFMQIGISNLVREVVRAEPALAELVKRYARAERERAEAWAALFHIYDSVPDDLRRLLATRDIAEFPQHSGAWTAAIEALKSDPDAPLPKVSRSQPEPLEAA